MSTYFDTVEEINAILSQPPSNNFRDRSPISRSERTMPITNADISSLCATLPEFTAGQNLSTFIKSVDNLLIFLQQQNTTAPQEFIINAYILSRIKGEPRDYLNYSNKTNWTDVRPALLTKYGDRRSEEILVTQLTTTVQKASESYDDYHHRIIDNLKDLLQHISLHNTPENLNFKTPYFRKLALKTFCTGLNNPYCEHLSHFQLDSLDEALQKCIALDNHKNQVSYMNFLKSQQKRKNQKQIILFQPRSNRILTLELQIILVIINLDLKHKIIPILVTKEINLFHKILIFIM
uniref:Uncharacterized protein LOC114346475 n=1 Tax=Diabrotica virgifera virgifera TaxID=50390 RepID=A0A6P7H3B2_DIAVI